jgi:hypothetical protein
MLAIDEIADLPPGGGRNFLPAIAGAAICVLHDVSFLRAGASNAGLFIEGWG